MIKFSTTREDPEIEIQMISKIDGSTLNVLMIASGGCTLFSILNDRIKHIDVVDQNINQIYLCQLKQELIGNEKYLDFIEGKLNTDDEYKSILNGLNLTLPCHNFWTENFELIKAGINKIGVFEQLFVDLVQSKFDYETVFHPENLIAKFGKAAVVYSTQQKFSTHFEKVINTLKSLYLPENNYFYHHLLHNNYNKDNLPSYLNPQQIENIKTNKNKVYYEHTDICQFILSKPDNYYHIINLSNVTDWLDQQTLTKLIQISYAKLKLKGYLIVRQLLSDYKMDEIISEYFHILSNVPVDKTHFYTNIFVAQKI